MQSKIVKTLAATLAVLALAACSSANDTVDDSMPIPDENEIIDEGAIPTPPVGEVDENEMPIPSEME